jgi:phosphoglycerate dehydrogenase-like enzyme
VHLFSAGADRVVKNPLFLETDIPFTNCSGVHGPQISEWVIMTALASRHLYNRLYENQKLRQWERSWVFGATVKDVVAERIGVLGYGAIGRQGKLSFIYI